MLRELKYSDLEDIRKWYTLRGKDFGSEDLYPNTGYIVPNCAAGWVYLTNSNLCFIENMITCPTASLRARYSATSAIADALIQMSYNFGCRYISVTTNIRSIAKLAVKKKFTLAETTNRYVLTLGK